MIVVDTDRRALPQSLLRHVVLFSFKDTATADQIKAIEEAFCALPGRIKEIHDFEWGTDVSVEGVSQEYTHCFLITFKDERDRDAYLPHPAHREFVSKLEAHLDRALVVDYWVQS